MKSARSKPNSRRGYNHKQKLLKKSAEKKLQVMAENWWDEVVKVPANEIGGYYWKVWVFTPNLAVGATDNFDSESKDFLNADVNQIKARMGRKATTEQALERISSTQPLLIVDRYRTPIGRLLKRLSFGRYKRYACINPYQALLRDLIEACVEQNYANDYRLHASIADQSLITRQYLQELSHNMSSYKREGFIDAK